MQAALRPISNPELKTRNPNAIPAKPATGRKIIFDDDLLDELYPKKPSYDGTAIKRKAEEIATVRGGAWRAGTKPNSSGSGDEDSDDSDSSQDE